MQGKDENRAKAKSAGRFIVAKEGRRAPRGCVKENMFAPSAITSLGNSTLGTERRAGSSQAKHGGGSSRESTMQYDMMQNVLRERNPLYQKNQSFLQHSFF